VENVHSSHGIWTEYWVEKDLWKTIFATLTKCENVHSSHGIWTEYWVGKDLWKTIFATLTKCGKCT